MIAPYKNDDCLSGSKKSPLRVLGFRSDRRFARLRSGFFCVCSVLRRIMTDRRYLWQS